MAPGNTVNSRYRNDFKEIHLLGKGGFGFVIKCQSRLNEECIYAIKCIQMGPHCESLEFMLREASNLARLQHKNVVRYFTAWIERDVEKSEVGKSEAAGQCKPTESREEALHEAGEIFRESPFALGEPLTNFSRGATRSSKSVMWASGPGNGRLRTIRSFDMAHLSPIHDHNDSQGDAQLSEDDHRQLSDDLPEFSSKATSREQNNPSRELVDSFWKKATRVTPTSSYTDSNYTVGFAHSSDSGSSNTVRFAGEPAQDSSSPLKFPLADIQVNSPTSVQSERDLRSGKEAQFGVEVGECSTSKEVGALSTVDSNVYRSAAHGQASKESAFFRHPPDPKQQRSKLNRAGITSGGLTSGAGVTPGSGITPSGATPSSYMDNSAASPGGSWQRRDDSCNTLYSNSDMSRTKLYIVMEYVDGCTLRKLISNRLCEQPELAWDLFAQILEGLSYMHKNRLLHRDVKPENIFLKASSEKANGDKVNGEKINGGERGHLYQVKIGDLGLSKSLENMSPSTTRKTGMMTLSETTSLSSGVGTHFYIAPEVEAGGRYDQAADIYALGVVFYEMLHPPFATTMERFQVLTQLQRTRKVEGVSNDKAAQLIAEMLSPDPSQRPSAAKLLERCVGTAIDFGSVIERVLENPYSYEMMKVLACLFNRKETGHSPASSLRHPTNSSSVAGEEAPHHTGNGHHSGVANHNAGICSELRMPVHESLQAQRLRSYVHRSMRCFNALFYDPPVLTPYNEKCIGWFDSAHRFVDTSGSALQPPSCFVHVMKTTLMAIQNATVCRRYTLGYVRGYFSGGTSSPVVHPSSPHTNSNPISVHAGSGNGTASALQPVSASARHDSNLPATLSSRFHAAFDVVCNGEKLTLGDRGSDGPTVNLSRECLLEMEPVKVATQILSPLLAEDFVVTVFFGRLVPLMLHFLMDVPVDAAMALIKTCDLTVCKGSSLHRILASIGSGHSFAEFDQKQRELEKLMTFEGTARGLYDLASSMAGDLPSSNLDPAVDDLYCILGKLLFWSESSDSALVRFRSHVNYTHAMLRSKTDFGFVVTSASLASVCPHIGMSVCGVEAPQKSHAIIAVGGTVQLGNLTSCYVEIDLQPIIDEQIAVASRQVPNRQSLSKQAGSKQTVRSKRRTSAVPASMACLPLTHNTIPHSSHSSGPANSFPVGANASTRSKRATRSETAGLYLPIETALDGEAWLSYYLPSESRFHWKRCVEVATVPPVIHLDIADLRPTVVVTMSDTTLVSEAFFVKSRLLDARIQCAVSQSAESEFAKARKKDAKGHWLIYLQQRKGNEVSYRLTPLPSLALLLARMNSNYLRDNPQRFEGYKENVNTYDRWYDSPTSVTQAAIQLIIELHSLALTQPTSDNTIPEPSQHAIHPSDDS